MSKLRLLSFLYVLSVSLLFGHEGHKEMHFNDSENTDLTQDLSTNQQLGNRYQSWKWRLGGLHLIFLHFPIALITMTAISELLFAWRRRAIFCHASRFMLISAAILAIPTALFGLIYSYTASYEGLLAHFIWWHMWCGIITAAFAVAAAFLRECKGISQLYYLCLLLLFLLVTITGLLGGSVTFGPSYLLGLF